MQKVTNRGRAAEFPITYARLLARELRLDRAGERRLLTGTRLSPDDLAALDRRIGAHDQLTVIRNALRLADRPGFGLLVGSRLSLAAHGALGQLLAASPTLGDGWRALARFHALRVPLVNVRLRTLATSVDILLEPACALDDAGLFLLEAMVVTVQRGIELVIGRRLRDARLMLGYPAPAHAAMYATFVHSPVRFDADHTAWRLPRALMDAPNPFRDDALFREAIRQCEAISTQTATTDSTAWHTRVSELLRAQPGALWTLVEVAAHFHVSPRTLIRHLKAEGTAYQRLLDRELARHAGELLLDPRHSVESTALAIGYRDATAFRRAFRRWTGLSPTEWLAQQAGGQHTD